MGSKIRNLQPGAPKAGVLTQLGTPDGFKLEDGRECLYYYNRPMGQSMWEKANYKVCFQEEKLVEARATETIITDPYAK